MRVLAREHAVAAAAMAAIVAVAWTYVWHGAGMGMSALDMTAAVLFPHRHPGIAGSMEPGWWLVALMWWVMMVAMMTPSAAPLVLLYARVRGAVRPEDRAAWAGPALVLVGYLCVWLAFAIAAAGLQHQLVASGLISEMMLWSRSALLSAGVLAAAGAYQFSPLKRACLAQCRSPAAFLSRHARPGRAAAFALGVRHGTFCVGCCWLLMALLFVGGVMNVLWIAILMLYVLAEKFAPGGERIGKATGAVLLAWAAATLFA